MTRTADCRYVSLATRVYAAYWGVYTVQQKSSKLPANVFKIHVLMLMDVCWIV